MSVTFCQLYALFLGQASELGVFPALRATSLLCFGLQATGVSGIVSRELLVCYVSSAGSYESAVCPAQVCELHAFPAS